MEFFIFFLGLMVGLIGVGWGSKYWKRVENKKKMGWGRRVVSKIRKPWGYEEIWAETDQYVGKILVIRRGECLSKQYHRDKDETIYLLSGVLELELEKNGAKGRLDLHVGDTYHIIPYTIHRMKAIVDCKVLEVSTPELTDVVRLEDKYGRK